MVFVLIAAWTAPGGAAQTTLQVGSKQFTESVLLGEIVTSLLNGSGINARHVQELGGSRLLWNALLAGELDVYAEYTGTLRQELLAHDTDLQQGRPLAEVLEKYGVATTEPIGFDNSYVIGVLESFAAKHSISRISDLRKYPEFRLGFSNEFMERGDGWPGLKALYQLQNPATGLDHDLAYRGLVAGELQGIDLYATDAEIKYYRIRVLDDDLGYFPDYQALILFRFEMAKSHPEAVNLLQRLVASVSQEAMIGMNAMAKLEKKPARAIAADFIEKAFGVQIGGRGPGMRDRLWQRTLEQSMLVGLSLSLAIVTAIPLGVLAARKRIAGQIILTLAGIMQTVPSLALLVFMIPLFGIGATPAIAALFLYSLLPIVRNTEAGLGNLSATLVESAKALGLTSWQRLRLVELPLAMRSILAGIKTAAVINIGTATLGALVGAGGYGQAILTGIRLDDTALIMEGAIPAALMALLTQRCFELLERRVRPPGSE